MKPKLQNTLLAICCADLMLLAACGGGGGGNAGMVRSDPPPAVLPPPTPPPPPPSAENVCPAPITSDCVADDRWKTESGSTIGSLYLYGGRQSNHGLIKRGTNFLSLQGGTYGFAGTSVEEGLLVVSHGATLNSAITVHVGGRLSVAGATRGDIVNRGHMTLAGMVTGQVINHGSFAPGAAVYDSNVVNMLVGDFRQTATGTLQVALPPAGWDFSGPLRITGRADIEGGALEFYQYWDWDSGYYPLPTTPSAIAVLHADGGVFGQFDRWIAPGLFIEGNVRYGSHDVWFDLTRASVQAVMETHATTDPQTLASAANLDAALYRADAFALAPAASLDAAQRQFLASAASLLQERHITGAIRSLDSLSGHAHALAPQLLHDQAATSASQLAARLEDLARGVQGGAWSSALRNEGGMAGGYSTAGQASGFDHWLTPQWLVGSSMSHHQGQLQLERMGGHGQGESPMASVYAHYRRGDWHATGLVGAGRTTLQLDRPIDLGAAGMHVAHSRRDLGQAFVHGELGRRVMFGNGQLTPFVAVDYSALHSDSFSEQGDTGFELVAHAGRSHQLSAAAGTRYTRDWSFGGSGWLQLNLDARYQRRLHDGGDAQQAAFLGVPEAVFDLTSWPQADRDATLELGLAGGFGERWTWSADYARRFGTAAGHGGWFVGLRRDF